MTNPPTPSYYLGTFEGFRTEISVYWTGAGWQFIFPNGTVYDIAPPLSWREFPSPPAPVPPINYVENRQRSEFMAALYRKAGRDRKGDPRRGTFTGLFQEAGF